MTLIIEQRDDPDMSAIRLASLTSDHQAEFWRAHAATPVRPAPVRAGVSVIRVAIARAQTPPAFVTATLQAS